jgi:AraC-like DNA-binding protein
MSFCRLIHVKSAHVKQRAQSDAQLLVGRRGAAHDEFAPPLQVLSFGAEHWVAGRYYERQRSEMFGVEYVVAGDAELVQDGKRSVAAPGQVYLLRSGVRHRYGAGPSGSLDKYYVSLGGALLDSLLLAAGLDGCDVVRPEHPQEIERLLLRIRELMQTKPAGFAMEQSMLAYRLLAELGRSHGRRYPQPVAAAVEFIDRNLTQPLSTAQICAAAGLSRTHFNRLFRRHVGVSAKQFFLRHRMGWARHLLADSDLPVKQIASTLGYDDPLYFSSQFRKQVGVGPRAYRRRPQPK